MHCEDATGSWSPLMMIFDTRGVEPSDPTTRESNTSHLLICQLTARHLARGYGGITSRLFGCHGFEFTSEHRVFCRGFFVVFPTSLGKRWDSTAN